MVMMKSFATFLNEAKDDDKLTPVQNTQYGSNPGGVHTDKKGEKHYVKFYKNPDQGKVETLTSKIYEHMGAKTTKPENRSVNGKHAVVTKWNDKLEPMQKHDFEHLTKPQAHDIGRKYHAAVLTKNWDAVGLEHDNIMKHKETGELHTVDNGGAMHFRAQGGHKTFSHDIDEHKSLRNMPGAASSHVFNHVFKHHPEAEHEGLKAVRNIDDKHVKSLFENSGLHNHKELHEAFHARKTALLAHYDSKK
jgi:hypothetical protein